MSTTYTDEQIGNALANLGNYRVKRTQEIAHEGPPDGISGILLLCLGLRETGLRNINNPSKTDKGCFQISDTYHHEWLRSEPGCRAGTWTPVDGHFASEPDFCPRFSPACKYAISVLTSGILYAKSRNIPTSEQVRFAIASYNAGVGGAYSGYKAGNVDKYTTGQDYSAWVLEKKPRIQRWINDHPNWKWTPEEG